MRFPSSDQLSLPCRFEQFVPGRLNHEGRRYLPLILLRLPDGAWTVDDHQRPLLSVVDRHHVVDPALVGRDGSARLVLLLSSIRLQRPPYRRGLIPEGLLGVGRASSVPLAYGQVVKILTWEHGQGRLPYETLYAELLLDIGTGIIGVRTSATAESLDSSLGTAQLIPGDWLEVGRSRIDILGFS